MVFELGPSPASILRSKPHPGSPMLGTSKLRGPDSLQNGGSQH